MDLYKDLLAFLDELKKYREEVSIKTDSKLLSEYKLEYEELRKLMNKSWAVYLEKYPLLKEYSSKIRREESREELREKLLHKSGQLQQHITKLVGTDEITIYEFGQPRSVNVWAMGLRQELDYRTNEALNACIDNTTVAIGKLELEEESWGVVKNEHGKDKKGLVTPIFQWFSNDLYEWSNNLISGFKKRGIKIERGRSRGEYDRYLYTLVSLELWYRIFIDAKEPMIITAER